MLITFVILISLQNYSGLSLIFKINRFLIEGLWMKQGFVWRGLLFWNISQNGDTTGVIMSVVLAFSQV